jgi:hypothetical protein
MKSLLIRTLSAGLIVGPLVLLTVAWSGCSRPAASPETGELMCKEHGVPEKFCTLCHPELKSRLLMCREHGVPEDICTLCHPELIERFGK